MVSKEYWANLSDEDKSKIIRRFCEINDIGPDFDYAKVRDFSERVKQKYKESGIYRNNQFWGTSCFNIGIGRPSYGRNDIIMDVCQSRITQWREV